MQKIKFFICGEAKRSDLIGFKTSFDIEDHRCPECRQWLPTIQLDNIAGLGLEEVVDCASVGLSLKTPESPIDDFLLNYRQILLGENADWRMIGIEADSEKVDLIFTETSPKSRQYQERIVTIEECSIPLRFKIPTKHDGDKRLAISRKRGKDYTYIYQGDWALVNPFLKIRADSFTRFEHVEDDPKKIKAHIGNFLTDSNHELSNHRYIYEEIF